MEERVTDTLYSIRTRRPTTYSKLNLYQGSIGGASSERGRTGDRYTILNPDKTTRHLCSSQGFESEDFTMREMLRVGFVFSSCIPSTSRLEEYIFMKQSNRDLRGIHK